METQKVTIIINIISGAIGALILIFLTISLNQLYEIKTDLIRVQEQVKYDATIKEDVKYNKSNLQELKYELINIKHILIQQKLIYEKTSIRFDSNDYILPELLTTK